MTALRWLLGILHVFVIFKDVKPIYFFDDETRRSEVVDSASFYKELEMELAGSKRTNIFSGTGSISFGHNWCSLTLSKSGNIITATVNQQNGCNPPSVKKVLDNHFSGNNFKTTTRILDGELFGVKSITIDESSHLVTMTTKIRNHESIYFVEYLRVGGYQDVDTEMVFSWHCNNDMSLENLNIAITGAAKLGAHKVTAEFKKKRGKENFEIKLNAPSTPIIASVIASTFHINTEGQLGRDGDNFKPASIVGKTWKKWNAYGALNSDDEYQIVIEHVTGTDDNQPFGFNDVNMKFIMNRFNSWEGEAVSAYPSLLMKIPQPSESHTMTTTANHFLKVENIMNLPIYGRPASKAWCMTVSPRDGYFMDTTKLQDPETFMCARNQDETIVEAGFNLKIKVKLRETFEEDCNARSSELANIPEEMEIKLIMGKTGVLTHLPELFQAPPRPTLICMGAGGAVPEPLFPDNVGAPLFELIEFEFKPKGKEEEEEEEEEEVEEGGGIGAGGGGAEEEKGGSDNSRPKKKPYFKVAFELTLPEGYNTIPNTKIGLGKFAFSAETNEDGGWDFSASASVVLDTIYVDISLEKTSSEWKFRIDIPSMTLKQILDLFKDIEAPTSPASALNDFGILDFAFEWTFGSSTIVRISGKPLLFGYDGAHLEGVYWKNKNVAPGRPKNAFALAVYFEDVNLDWILQKCTGSGKLSMKWLSNLSAVIAISNANGVVEGKEEEEEEEQPSSSTSSGKKQTTSSTRAIVNASVDVAKPLHHVISPRVRRSNPSSKIISYKKNVDQKKYLANLKKSSSAGGSKDSDNEDDEDPSISFEIPLPETEIKPGLTFLLTYTVPTKDTECLKNSMCEWLVKNLQEGSIQLSGHVGGGEVELAAAIRAKIKLLEKEGKLLLLTDIEFKLSIGSENPGIRLECRLRYTDPNLSGEPLIFMGAIEVDFTGSIRLEFAMGGIIEQPFGNQYLAFGNLYLSIGYSFGAVPLPSLAFAAELWLGKLTKGDSNNNDHAIKIKAGFGIDPNKPKDFWVFAEFNKLSIAGVCEAFKLHCDGIPKSVADSGFPEGLTLSYSLEERSIPVIGLEVRAGFYLKGKIKIFDLEASGEIAINPAESSFLVDIRMAPINWVGGLIKIQRNNGDSENGPMCKIAVDGDSFDVHIEGYAEVLGINGGIKVIVSDEEFQFNVNGTMWPGIFDASIDLRATYGSWDTMSFSIVVDVRTSSLMEKLRAAVKEFCKRVGAAAKKAFDDADTAFDAAQSKLGAAKDKVNGWKNNVNAWKSRLQRRYNELERRKRETQTSCKSRCPKVCFGFLDWNSRCWKFWGHWCGCLYWNSCFRMIDDIICLAGCELNKLWKKFVIWVEQVGIKIAMAMGDIANGLLSMANGVLAIASEVVEFGRKLKDFVGDVVQGALQALKWLVEKIGDIFWLNKLQLRASMDADFNACVGYTIDCKVFGFKVKGSGDACLNLGFIKSLVGRAVDGDGSPPELKGITNTEQNLEEAEGKKRSLADANKKLQEEEVNTNRKVTEETRKNYDEEMSRRDAVPRPETLEFLKKLPKRTTVPTKEEMKYIIAANEPIPAYVKGQDSIAAFESHPWFDNAEITPAGVNDIPAKDSTSTLSKRGFDFESAMSPCERMGKALSNYADVTNGLLTSARSLKEQNTTFKRTLNEEASKISNFKQRIEQLEQRHNLTEQERQDAYFWYNKLEGGMNDFSRRSETAMIKQDSYALPIIQNQLSYVLNAEKGSTFKEFADLIHHNAMQGYKRSAIPKHVEDGEKVLVSIKRDLVAILTNTDDPLTSMHGRLQIVKRNIESMNHHVKNCRNN